MPETLENAVALDQHGNHATQHAQPEVSSTSEKFVTPAVDESHHDIEKEWDPTRTSLDGSNGITRTESGVNVEQAEKDFQELSRRLSQHSRRVSQIRSRSSKIGLQDEEKGISVETSSEEDWDLEDTLRGAKQADQAAGIKSKYIGVIWDRLTVRGIG